MHNEITEAVKEGLREEAIKGVRADDKRYHDDLFYNILTYMHGCGLGMAIYDRIDAETYNPNVALEVGYMFALRKPVCLLKDQTLWCEPIFPDSAHSQLPAFGACSASNSTGGRYPRLECNRFWL